MAKGALCLPVLAQQGRREAAIPGRFVVTASKISLGFDFDEKIGIFPPLIQNT